LYSSFWTFTDIRSLLMLCPAIFSYACASDRI
jgi:hypothetical protein